MLAQLRSELSSFVCKGQYEDGMARILDSFLRGRSQTQPEGGLGERFYGQRQSHFEKMLCHLGWIPCFPDARRHGAWSRICLKMSAASLAELDIVRTQVGRTAGRCWHVAFGDVRPGSSVVLAIPVRAVELPDQYSLARFYLWLEEQGFLATVKSAVEAPARLG